MREALRVVKVEREKPEQENAHVVDAAVKNHVGVEVFQSGAGVESQGFTKPRPCAEFSDLLSRYRLKRGCGLGGV